MTNKKSGVLLKNAARLLFNSLNFLQKVDNSEKDEYSVKGSFINYKKFGFQRVLRFKLSRRKMDV